MRRCQDLCYTLCLGLVVVFIGSSVRAALPVLSSAPQLSSEYEGFIRVQNQRFVDANCRDFPLSGMNTWLMVEAAAGATTIPCTLPTGMDEIQYTFSTAAKNGFTVARVFGQGMLSPLQISPGVYNETMFAAIDYILDTAAYNNVKVIFVLSDNWQYEDSKRNYNTWAGFDGDSDQFWTNEKTRQMYKDHLNVVVNRVNTLNGVKYRDDPTIFSWNLMNEPRCNCFPTVLPYPPVFATLPQGCEPSCADSITAWVGEMSAYLKSLDSNHLVTVGEEGFWGFNDPDAQYNPENSVSPWASLTGNNFTAQHSFDTIDYTSIHYWPDQWTPKADGDTTFFTSWMQQHESVSLALNKPLVLEELGKQITQNSSLSAVESNVQSIREPFMEMVYGQFNQSLQSGGIWRGTLFWKWGFCPQNTVSNFLEVSAGDPDFKNVIAPAALSALSLADSISPVAGCAFVEVANISNAYAPDIAPALSPGAPQASSPNQGSLPTYSTPPPVKTSSVTPIQTLG